MFLKFSLLKELTKIIPEDSYNNFFRITIFIAGTYYQPALYKK